MTDPGKNNTKDRFLPTTTTEMDIVAPASAEKILDAFKAFEWMKANIITDADRQKIADRQYTKKSGWMKIALACNISMEKREERVEKDDDETVYHYTYRAIAPSGRFADASASSGERKFTHRPHDIRALAQTRACNRAISNLVGGGEVSAEEMTDVRQAEAEPNAPVLNKASIIDALESVGLDTEDLEISVKEGKMVVRPTKFLAADWDKYNQAMWKLGMTWVSGGKESHWKSGE